MKSSPSRLFPAKLVPCLYFPASSRRVAAALLVEVELPPGLHPPDSLNQFLMDFPARLFAAKVVSCYHFWRSARRASAAPPAEVVLQPLVGSQVCRGGGSRGRGRQGGRSDGSHRLRRGGLCVSLPETAVQGSESCLPCSVRGGWPQWTA